MRVSASANSLHPAVDGRLLEARFSSGLGGRVRRRLMAHQSLMPFRDEGECKANSEEGNYRRVFRVDGEDGRWSVWAE